MTIGAELPADDHYAFGEIQRNWFINELKGSKTDGTKWRIIGSDDVFGQSPPSAIFNGRDFFGEDKLEGYDAERQIIIDAIIDNDIDNVVCFAGGKSIHLNNFVIINCNFFRVIYYDICNFVNLFRSTHWNCTESIFNRKTNPG